MFGRWNLTYLQNYVQEVKKIHEHDIQYAILSSFSTLKYPDSRKIFYMLDNNGYLLVEKFSVFLRQLKQVNIQFINAVI